MRPLASSRAPPAWERRLAYDDHQRLDDDEDQYQYSDQDEPEYYPPRAQRQVLRTRPKMRAAAAPAPVPTRSRAQAPPYVQDGDLYDDYEQEFDPEGQEDEYGQEVEQEGEQEEDQEDEPELYAPSHSTRPASRTAVPAPTSRKPFSGQRRPVMSSTTKARVPAAPSTPRSRSRTAPAPAPEPAYDDEYDRLSALDDEEEEQEYVDDRIQSYGPSYDARDRSRTTPSSQAGRAVPRASFSSSRNAPKTRAPIARPVPDYQDYGDEYDDGTQAHDDREAFDQDDGYADHSGTFGRSTTRKPIPSYTSTARAPSRVARTEQPLIDLDDDEPYE